LRYYENDFTKLQDMGFLTRVFILNVEGTKIANGELGNTNKEKTSICIVNKQKARISILIGFKIKEPA